MGPRILWMLAKVSTTEQIRFYFVNRMFLEKKSK